MTTASMEFDEPLFDIDLSHDEQFTVPEELAEFDRGITDKEIEVHGDAAFVEWLKARLKKQFVTTPISPVTTACEEERIMSDDKLPRFGTIKVRANFFPDYPYPEDFQDGEANLEYRRLAHEADLSVAYAKAACDSCPIRRECLASSIVNYEESGVWGGWSAGARSYIHDHFKSLKRRYLKFESAQKKDDFDPQSEDFQEELAMWAEYMSGSKGDLSNLNEDAEELEAANA